MKILLRIHVESFTFFILYFNQQSVLLKNNSRSAIDEALVISYEKYHINVIQDEETVKEVFHIGGWVGYYFEILYQG